MKNNCEHKNVRKLFINLLKEDGKRTFRMTDKRICLDCNKIIKFIEEEEHEKS